MDGLSAAASGMAIISLAIQLADSVGGIQRLLRNVSEAPKELNRLIDLLEQLKVILEHIRALIERQRGQTSDRNNGVSATVWRAMKTCECKLAVLKSIVEAAKTASTATNKATRALGSLRLIFKKKDIDRFEIQLHDAVMILNLTITTNLRCVVIP